MTLENSLKSPFRAVTLPHIYLPVILRSKHDKAMAAYEEKLHDMSCRLERADRELEETLHCLHTARAEAEAGVCLAEAEGARASEAEELFRLQADELKSANADISVLEGRVACLQPERRQADIDQAAKARMAMASLPASAADVLRYFENAFSDRVVFTEEAFRLAKDCSIPVDELYRCLFNLATILTDLYRAHETTPYEAFEERTGTHIGRGYGNMTHRNNTYHSQFVAVLDGRTIETEAHITWPRLGQTITFGYDRITDKLVIDRVGVHPEIFTTRHGGR